MGWKQYFVYVMTNRRHNVLYTGVSNSLERRVWEHKNEFAEGFTKKYKCHKLVYYEIYDEIDQAIAREKQIKGWSRFKKDQLINRMNPDWNDLAADWYDDHLPKCHPEPPKDGEGSRVGDESKEKNQ